MAFLIDINNFYVNIKIICNTCKDIYLQTPSDHLVGKNIRCSCNTLTEKRFLKEAKEKHNNDYDFSNINYINSKTVIKFKCNECKQILEKTPIEVLICIVYLLKKSTILPATTSSSFSL